MDDIVTFLHSWQELVGAILGGIFALGVALLVGYITRRNDDVAAAMLLVGSLTDLKARESTLRRLAAEKGVSAEDYPMWVSEKLVFSKPKISAMFEASMVRLMPLNTHLAVHLDIYRTVFLEMESKLDLIAGDYRAFHEKGKADRPKELMLADSRVVRNALEKAARHGKCAERLLTNYVLSNWPTFNRVRARFFPTSQDAECEKLVRTGH